MKSPKLAFQTGSRCGNPSSEYTDLSRAAFHSIVYAKIWRENKVNYGQLEIRQMKSGANNFIAVEINRILDLRLSHPHTV